MPIKQLLELSALHVTPKDVKILDDLAGYGIGQPPRSHPVAVNRTATGYIVRVRDLTEERAAGSRELGLSGYFMGITEYAINRGAAVVILDLHAEYEPGLPHFATAHAEVNTFEEDGGHDYDNDAAVPDELASAPKI